MLFLLGWGIYGIYGLFTRDTLEPDKEPPFVPYYYALNGREVYYKSKPDERYPAHYTLAVTSAPYASLSPNDAMPSEPFGEEAKKFVQSAISSKDIFIERLGHTLYAYIWLGIPENSSDVKTIEQQMLNAQMIAKGYSEYFPIVAPDKTKINPTYERVFLSLQKEAQNKRIGIWSLPENSPEARAKATEQRLKEEKEAEEEARKEKISEGKEKKMQQQEYLKNANTVVITSRGKKYYYTDCATVKGKTRTITIKQALKRGYKPCGVCEPPDHEITLENSGIDWDETIHVYRVERRKLLED